MKVGGYLKKLSERDIRKEKRREKNGIHKKTIIFSHCSVRFNFLVVNGLLMLILAATRMVGYSRERGVK